ncbi:MAG TPA: FtsQ-type POTRA domain-containing protein, partial [Candidatus Acidoferrales bacterium]|nr:FtsQ-type POTRA domain-containing protein [Candidatus Acidoferrales bacterium]
MSRPRRRRSWFRLRRSTRFAGIEPGGRPLKGQVWTHSEAVYQEPGVHPAWRGLAAGLAVAEVALLAWLVAAPGFTVRHVEVRGLRHLTAAEVTVVAGLDRPVSIFAVDAQAGRQRLGGLAWVRTAGIQPQLPDRVLVSLTEWQPVAVFHAGPGGRRLLLSDQGTALAAAGPTEPLLEIEGPAGADPRPGGRALD